LGWDIRARESARQVSFDLAFAAMACRGDQLLAILDRQIGRQQPHRGEMQPTRREFLQESGVRTRQARRFDASIGRVFGERQDFRAIAEHRRAALGGIQPPPVYLGQMRDQRSRGFAFASNEALEIAVRPLLLVLALLAAPPVAAQTIGVYRDHEGAQCPVIPPFMPTMVCVVVTLAPGACGGFAGVGFRLTGWPQNWFYIVDHGPGIPPIGDLFNSGYYLAWPSCRTSESGAVAAFTFRVFATSQVSDLPVGVTYPAAAKPPVLCPVLALCDAPVFTQICATGVTTRINPIDGFCPCQGPCFEECPPVSVERDSWSRIKKLFD
jgi:hypothetical protein